MSSHLFHFAGSEGLQDVKCRGEMSSHNKIMLNPGYEKTENKQNPFQTISAF